MRRVVGLVLLALGVFGVALGLLLRLYAYDRLAVVPLNRSGESIAVGEGMTVFYPSTLRQEHGVNVTATRRVQGNPKAAEAKPDGGVMVWDVGLVIEDANGTLVSSSLDHLCLDRRTNEAVQPCAGEGISEDDGKVEPADAVAHRGLAYKFPFGTEKRNYAYFDNSAKKAFTIWYRSTETIEGVETYKFVQKVPQTKLDDRQVPGSIVGRPDVPSLTVGRYYENTRTLWVEPYSGIIVKGREELAQTLRGAAGSQPLTVFGGTIEFTPDTVKKSAADAKDARSQLRLLRVVGPVGSISVGVVLALLGATLYLLGGGGGASATGRPAGRLREPQPV
jgi:hypothetical protein